MGTAQGISSLSLLTYFTSWAYRSGTEYTVRNNLIALLRTAILTSPLVELHIARHTDQVAFTVFSHICGSATSRPYADICAVIFEAPKL